MSLYNELGEDTPSDLGIAMIRVKNILHTQKVACMKTLEVKICECGKQRVLPHWITEAINKLKITGDVIGRRDKEWPCEVFYLAGTKPHILERTLVAKIPLIQLWHDFASRTGSNGFGPIGERVVGQAIAQSNRIIALQWGNVTHVHGIRLPSDSIRAGSADGLIMLASTLDILGLIEVKNQRGQIPPCDPILWDIIRKAYAVDAVPILIARLMYPSTKGFVLKRVGGFGINLFSQFAPSSMETILADCKHKNGLGFKDIDFGESPPKGLIHMLEVLAKKMPSSKRRMHRVRHLVQPYLEILSDKTTDVSTREESYRRLQWDLDDFDGIPTARRLRPRSKQSD